MLVDHGEAVECGANWNLIPADLSLELLPISPGSPSCRAQSNLRSYVFLYNCQTSAVKLFRLRVAASRPAEFRQIVKRPRGKETIGSAQLLASLQGTPI